MYNVCGSMDNTCPGTHFLHDSVVLALKYNQCLKGASAYKMKGTKVLTLGAVDMSSHGFTA